MDPGRLYSITGLQFLPFNTLYQLAADDLTDGSRMLLISDLLGYWLTGAQVAEQTNASTTGLLDARSGRWADELVEASALPRGLLPDVVEPGVVLAPVRDDVREELGVERN